MAERRMFAKTIIDSDAFLDMPLTSQALYFHLSMRADDDGFINNPKKIQRMIGCSDDDLKLLTAKRFIVGFDDGIIVIKHWRMHNYIRPDRYKPTVYQEELSQLVLKENKSYQKLDANDLKVVGMTCGIPSAIPVVNQKAYQTDTQVRLGKDSIGKDNKILVSDSDEPHTLTSKKYNDEHLRLANKLKDVLANDFPKEMKLAEKHIDKWADTIRLLEERDEQSIEAIEYVIDWLPTNEFWIGNIRSATKLRKQFEKLKHEIRLEKEKAKKAANNRYGKPIREEPLPDWAKKELDGQSDAVEAETVTSDEPSDSGELKKRIEALNRGKTR